MPAVLIATNTDLLKSLSANRAKNCTYMSMLSIKIHNRSYNELRLRLLTEIQHHVICPHLWKEKLFFPKTSTQLLNCSILLYTQYNIRIIPPNTTTKNKATKQMSPVLGSLHYDIFYLGYTVKALCWRYLIFSLYDYYVLYN